MESSQPQPNNSIAGEMSCLPGSAMPNMQYEYKTTFFPITYQVDTEMQGRWFFKTEKLLQKPLPESLMYSTEYEDFANEMGKKGWELVSVQPLLEGIYGHELGSNTSGGYGYSLTAGYFFFWKRPLIANPAN